MENQTKSIVISKPSEAPKDGCLIIAFFKGDPAPVAAVWNGASKEWCTACPHVEPINGEWNDWYFENEGRPDSEMQLWFSPDIIDRPV